MSVLDVAKARSHFPALSGKQVYFDNAGGSQVLKEVVDAIVAYLSNNNVQLGASYPISQTSTQLFHQGCAAVAKYINTCPENVVLGASTTQLFRNLSISLYDYIDSDSEIIVSLLDHEANISPWVQLAKDRNAKLIWWAAEDPKNPQLDPNVLKQLLTPKTKLVTCTHTSNILGTINPIRAIAEAVHSIPGALFCVDAVAYAPHRPVDVVDLGVDFYAFSWYKLYGPHISSLYASPSAQKRMRTLGHFFRDASSMEKLLGLAGASYELTASIPAVCQYLASVPWDETARHEEELQKTLIEHLLSRPEVYQIRGQPSWDRAKRVPVISFTVQGRRSKDVVDAIEARSDFGCRWGAFYSNRLAEHVLGLDPVDGVVRVSLLHYNTQEEVEGYVRVLDEVVRGSS